MTTSETPADAAEIDPLESILRLCAAAAPLPWYPRQFAKKAGISLADFAADVEFLWLEGYLVSASQPGDRVPGVMLSETGKRLLADPAELAALCDRGHGVRARDRHARGALRGGRTPVVSRTLLVINVLVFGAGIWLALGLRSTWDFLAGASKAGVIEVLHRLGSVSADDIVAGQSWRLLSAAFVHAGALHLLMNMSVLGFSFSVAEAMWGRARYLVIYLIAAFGGNCVAMAWLPVLQITTAAGDKEEIPIPLVGASGALCGVLAATIVWVAFNGRHLPRSTAQQLRTGLLSSVILLVFISFFPHVSGLCHLGGALFGAAAAVLLDFQRWRRGVFAWTAGIGLIGLPWLGLHLLDRARETDPRWHRVERRVFERLYRRQVANVVGDADDLYRRHIAPVLRQPPRQRDEAQLRRALGDAVETHSRLMALADTLAKAGPYRDADAEKVREEIIQRVDALLTRYAEAAEVLQQNTNSPERNEAEKAAFSRQFLQRIHDTMNRAIALTQGEIKDLLKSPPGERNRDDDVIALTALKQLVRDLKALDEALTEAGPYGNQEIEQIRTIARKYVAARLAQMEEITRCVRAGKNWTAEDEAKLQTRSGEAAAARKEWDQLFEKD